MPKKGGKAAPVDDPETIAKKKKRIKEITDRWLNEANILPDKALVDKIYASQVRHVWSKCRLERHAVLDALLCCMQGWNEDDPKATDQLVFAAQNREGTSGPDVSKIDSLAVKQFGKAMKEMCPLHCKVKAMAFWRQAVEDEGIKGIVEFASKPPKPDVWEGLVALELVECNISAVGCDLLGEKLKVNIPLKSLCLDHNPIGNTGLQHLAEALKNNSKVTTLSLAWCGISSEAAHHIADGLIQGSKIKRLDLKGNRLGIHTAHNGQSLHGFSLIPIFAALQNPVAATLADLQAKARMLEEQEPSQERPPVSPAPAGEDAAASTPPPPPPPAPAYADELEALLKGPQGYRATDAIEGLPPGTWQATQGPYKGWELFITEDPPPGAGALGSEDAPGGADVGRAVGGGKRLMVLTETLTKIGEFSNDSFTGGWGMCRQLAGAGGEGGCCCTCAPLPLHTLCTPIPPQAACLPAHPGVPRGSSHHPSSRCC